MKLTGKCRAEFEKWFVINLSPEDLHKIYHYHDPNYIGVKKTFWELPESMQYGVLVDYFDSVGWYVEVYFNHHDGGKNWLYTISEQFNDLSYTTRPEARTKAIDKANEIRNEQLNKKQ